MSCACLVLLLTGLLAGSSFGGEAAPFVFLDDLHRQVSFSKVPHRVVSLAPSITEILFAIGLGERVVGVTQFCDYPPETQAKPKVGYTHPNLEAIVALQPDLIVAPREILRADVLGKLDQLRIPTYVLDAQTVDSILGHIQTLGRILGASVAADELADRLRRRIEDITARTSSLPRPRVLYVLSSEPLITVGPGSFIHQLIELAGGSNVAARARVAYPRLSMEAVLKEDPEVLLFPSGRVEGIAGGEELRWERWATLAAVKLKRLHRVPNNVLNRPGPRIIEGLEALARIFHPEAFDERKAP
ncbi:MAG: cobalamin-binding protein [Nitrospirae bacterium 13_2_20CM_2_61_4]|nr:MAG: cobalamin-binding protein [Nitrospirae bacterium 13_2_20CM_2_61_4]